MYVWVHMHVCMHLYVWMCISVSLFCWSNSFPWLQACHLVSHCYIHHRMVSYAFYNSFIVLLFSWMTTITQMVFWLGWISIYSWNSPKEFFPLSKKYDVTIQHPVAQKAAQWWGMEPDQDIGIATKLRWVLEWPSHFLIYKTKSTCACPLLSSSPLNLQALLWTYLTSKNLAATPNWTFLPVFLLHQWKSFLRRKTPSSLYSTWRKLSPKLENQPHPHLSLSHAVCLLQTTNNSKSQAFLQQKEAVKSDGHKYAAGAGEMKDHW